MHPAIRRLIATCALALILLAFPALGNAHQDPQGDVHPTVQVEDGKFVVYFSSNTEPKIETPGEPGEPNSRREPVYKTVLSPEGKVLEQRVPVQPSPDLFPEWLKRLRDGDPFGVFDQQKEPLLPAEWPDGKRPDDLKGITIFGNRVFFYFTGGKDESFRMGVYDLDQKKLLQSAVIGNPGRIYSFASASEVIARENEAWIAWIEERNVKREPSPDGTAGSYSSDTQVVVSRWDLEKNRVTHLPIRQTINDNISLSLNRIGDHLLVAWHEGIGASGSRIEIKHIDLSTANFTAELPLSPLPSNVLKSLSSP